MQMTITTDDSLSLNVWRSESNFTTSVIFINALGISCAIIAALSQAVTQRGANFITWDRRGFPGSYDDNFRYYGPAHAISDLVTLTTQMALNDVVLAAWCTGAQPALGAIATDAIRPRKLVLFNNPNYFGDGFSGVQGDAIGKISQSIVKDERKLDFFYDVIAKASMPLAATSEAGPDSLSLQQQQQIQAPFISGKQALLRYAHLICNAGDLQQTRRWCKGVTVPTLLVASAKDHMVSCQDAQRLSALLPNARLEIMPDWGHYSLFSQADQAADKIITSGESG